MSTIPECLFVLIDVPPTHPSYTPVIETTLALINIHLISGGENQLVVFDTCGSKPVAVFSSLHRADTVDRINLQAIEVQPPIINDHIRSALSARRPTSGEETTSIIPAFMSAVCMANRLGGGAVLRVPARFLVVGSRDISLSGGSGQTDFINALFVPQREGWPVDCLFIGPELPLCFQQAAYLTNGRTYTSQATSDTFAAEAVSSLSPALAVRALMGDAGRTVAGNVHNVLCVDAPHPTEFGYVCSKCMTVHARFHRICMGCGMEIQIRTFEPPQPQAPAVPAGPK